MKARTSNQQLRCLCSGKRLLAYYGKDKDGQIYFHVMAHRSGRVLANVVVLGSCEIQCPSCLRWNILTVKADGDMSREESLDPPAEISET